MITFFPALLATLVWCSVIQNKRHRRAAQAAAITVYAVLGAMFV